MLSVKKLWTCFKDAFMDTIQHDGIEHAGYLAFLAILSLFPFLVFLVALAGFLGQLDIGARFVEIVLGHMPHKVIIALQPRIVEIVSGPPQGLLTVAIIGAIWTASSTVEGMRTALNRAYRVATPPAYIWRRLLSIIQFLVLTALILLLMLLVILIPVIWQMLPISDDVESFIRPLWRYISYGMLPLALFCFVTLFYFVLPNIKQRWAAVLPGAVIVVIAWMIAGRLVVEYLSDFNQVNLIYGSLAGIIGALLFFYVMSTIFIFGAELNYHIERALGHRIEQKEPVDVLPS